MKTNIINGDRAARLVIALILITLYFAGIITGTLGIILLTAGIIFFLTSFIGFCPIYWTLGFRGEKNKENIQ